MGIAWLNSSTCSGGETRPGRTEGVTGEAGGTEGGWHGRGAPLSAARCCCTRPATILSPHTPQGPVNMSPISMRSFRNTHTTRASSWRTRALPP